MTQVDTDTAVITYQDEETGLVFRWHGGAYIDVGTVQNVGQPGIDGDDFHAYDVINVWDDEADASYFETETPMPTPSIRRPFRYILEQFEARCRQYIKEQGEDEDV